LALGAGTQSYPNRKEAKKVDFIKFLGTAGARFVVTKQLRASGGIWISLNGTNIYLDPGPGALVKCLSSKPKLEPSQLSAIILSHKHIDHSNDINIMIEAMTEGGFKKKGVLFAPQDALDSDPVVLKYIRKYLEKVEILKEGKNYKIGGISFSTPIRHKHPVETYGLIFSYDSKKIAFIIDTLYFEELAKAYKADMLIMNISRYVPHESGEVEHLCLDDGIKLIKTIKPEVAVLTHFGMTMIKNKPWEIAAKLEKELKIKVIAASDGLTLNLEEIL